MPEATRIVFELRLQDYLAAQEHLVGVPLRRARTLSVVLGLSTTLLLITLGLVFWREPQPFLLGVLGGVAVVGITQIIGIARVRRHCSPPPGRGTLCRHEVLVSDDGLHVLTSRIRAVHAWSGIRELHETTTHVFFVHDEGMAQVVPKSAFGQLSALQSFLAAARASLARANGAGDVGPAAR
ncbi:MAG TPA: YcxB family protein [Polyangiaceae bacterium]|nr:YcxB family protein [Polyangiaceae bacterium]